LYFNRLKQKWGITSNFQLGIIFIVFGITGSLSVKFAKPLLDFFQINSEQFETLMMGNAIYWVLRIVIVFPIYQVLLLIFGTLFFQFRFFWNFEKKILKRIGFKCLFKDS